MLEDSIVCLKDHILNYAQYGDFHNACEYVEQACEEQWEYLNFLGFYYCNLDQNVPLILLVALGFVLFAFNFLGTTADTYLAPSLEVLSEKLELSEAIAGVTLLAFANGAADVISGVVAGGKEEGGVTIAIGGLFGACFFTVTIVLARTIQGAGDKGIEVEKEGTIRDIITLLIGSFYFIALVFYNEINTYTALGFFGIYLVFVVVVILQERARIQKQEEERKAEEERQKKEDEAKDRVKARFQIIKKAYAPKLHEKHSAGWNNVIGPYLMKRMILHKKGKTHYQKKQEVHREDEETEKLNVKEGEEGQNDTQPQESIEDEKVKRFFTMEHKKDFYNQFYVDEGAKEITDEEEEDNSCYGKTMRVYNAPLFFIRDLTIPPFEEEKWVFWKALVTPTFGLIFIFWQLGILKNFYENWIFWAVYAGLDVVLTTLIYLGGRNGKNMAKSHGGILSVIGFFLSCMWIFFIASLFMDFLSLLAVISGLPLNYLSLSLLAWGNSLDDFFVDYVIARNGHGRMAVIGVFGGQIFNLYIGFGGAMLRQAMSKTIVLNVIYWDDLNPVEVKASILTIVLVLSLIVGLVVTLIMAAVRDWKIGSGMNYFLMIYYISFLVVVSLISVFY